MQQAFRVALTLQRRSALDYLGGGTWRLWLQTPDYVHGTFLTLYSDGRVHVQQLGQMKVTR
jgi:hypothetical protein